MLAEVERTDDDELSILASVAAEAERATELSEEARHPFQLTADVNSFGNDLTPREEKEEEEEDNRLSEVLCTLFVLGRGCHQDRHLDVVSNEIILASNRSPFRNITFTLNRWAHLMTALNDIDAVVKRLTAMDENEGRRLIACCRHLGDGYYVRVLFGLRCVDFRKYFVPYGYKASQIRSSTNGINICIDEWKDLLEVIIPTVNHRFPQFASAKQCTYGDDHLGQLDWLHCTSCFPFGHDEHYY